VNSKDPNRIEFPELGGEGPGDDAGGVDEVDDDNAEDLRRRNRKIKLEKYTMGKVLR
jgi:hypothetical protein